MKKQLTGRKNEQEILRKALHSDEAEMVSVIGRRRVGKTFLIRTAYAGYIDFEVSGIQNAQGDEQLRNFTERLKEFFPSTLIPQTPKDWLAAFMMLITCLREKRSEGKQVVFFDEVPWLNTHKSGFLRGLSYFWNSWAVQQQIVVVLCGSAASWMINKILRNKGGLHNRVSRRIRLKPFTLAETETYLTSRNIHFDRYQLAQLYMAMGGIPHYLKEIEPGKSVVQNIDHICFSEDGLLRDEFESLYPALFDHAEYHKTIIRTLASKQSGLTRKNIITTSRLPDGGRITRVLEELSESGFITAYFPFGKRKKDKLYRLTDEYSLFYLRFIEKNLDGGENTWKALSQSQSYKIWSGYAFENICLKHIRQIKQALGISGIYSAAASFTKKGNDEEAGTQIDLLIDRNDHIINLIESKFYNAEFTLSKEYATKLRTKRTIFQESTKTRKHIAITLISTFGLKHNKHSLGLIEADMDLDALFG